MAAAKSARPVWNPDVKEPAGVETPRPWNNQEDRGLASSAMIVAGGDDGDSEADEDSDDGDDGEYFACSQCGKQVTQDDEFAHVDSKCRWYYKGWVGR